MSFSSPISTSNTSRRKSCNACIRGKRRCGQEYPRCTRCSLKAIDCQYAGLHARSRYIQTPNPQIPLNPQPVVAASQGGIQVNVKSPVPSFIEDEAQVSSFFDSSSLFATSYTNFDDAVITIDAMRSEANFGSTTLPRDRVIFCVQQFKSYPSMLLQHGRTPFIHPALYSEDAPFPHSIQEAYSACALYLSKTEKTSATILKIIESKNDDLLASAGSWTIAEHLAALQAMCLLQIIRLFDGDIRQRALAEQQEHILPEWTTSLSRRTQTPPSPSPSKARSSRPPGPASASAHPPSWDSWVFAESLRRTMVVAWMIHGVYAVVKQGFCFYAEVVTGMPFTAQGQLWNALSAFHWEKAWREKRHFDIERMQFDELLDAGTAEDVDELGLMMMAAYVGVDRVREWTARSGAQLVEP